MANCQLKTGNQLLYNDRETDCTLMLLRDYVVIFARSLIVSTEVNTDWYNFT